MEQNDTPRHILLATTGESPQVVTETLYAIHQERLTWPDEIRLITTTVGKARAQTGLLADGHLSRLCNELGRPVPAFNEGHIEVVPSADGSEVDDARSLEDHEALADFIMTRVRDLTKTDKQGNPINTLHASLAGGRKTMTFYLGYALSLFGRREDRLTHVLVNEKCYESSNFWFPTTDNEHRFFKDWQGNFVLNKQGQPAEASPEHAQVNLADIPFIRQRHSLPKVLRSLDTEDVSFREVVQLINLGEQPENLRLTIKPLEQKIIIDSLAADIAITPVELSLGRPEMAFYTVFAKATKNSREIARPGKDESNLELLKYFLDELMPMCGLKPQDRPIDALDDLEDWSADNKKNLLNPKTLAALRGEKKKLGSVSNKRKLKGKVIESKLITEETEVLRSPGITKGWFDDRRTDLRELLSERLPQTVIDCLLPSHNNTKGGNYIIPLPADNIHIL